MKDELLITLNAHLDELIQLAKAIRANPSTRVSQSGLKDIARNAARRWFDDIRPNLEKIGAAETILMDLTTLFDSLLQMSRGQGSRSSYTSLLSEITAQYKASVIHKIEVGTVAIKAGSLSIAPYIEGLSSIEGDYLDEAQRCLAVNGLRACIVLGWCATIARIHEKIAELGYPAFNKASEDMTAKSYGRFKFFNKKFKIDSLSDLQATVFDTDLLWVLEHLQFIDANQHERLRHNFTLRNQSAHPGTAPIVGENVYSFYSDITKIVLKNPKFSLAPEP
jgi:hypothetical protein